MTNAMMVLAAVSESSGVRGHSSAMFFGDGYMLSYLLCIAALILSIVCSARVKSTFAKYSKVDSKNGTPAWMVAKRILESNGLYDVDVVRTSGHLTDHYDPRTNVVALSDSVYDSTSLAAIGVAAHECGHAVQHAQDYIPIKLRTLIVPVANFGGRAYFYIFLLGIVMGIAPLVNIGIILFAFVVLFQLVTLPVEFNASSRAIRTLDEQGVLGSDEIPAARKTLNAAAMTYVASLAVSATQLLRLLLLSRRNRR